MRLTPRERIMAGAGCTDHPREPGEPNGYVAWFDWVEEVREDAHAEPVPEVRALGYLDPQGDTMNDEISVPKTVGYVVLALVLLVFLGVGGLGGGKEFSRYQKRADAENNVKVTNINIRRAQQQARIVAAQDATVKAQADQRLIAAVGIRKAQDEVGKTLTPLYVQFEAVQAQLAMAKSQNHTIVYVPSTTNGTPVITQDATADGK